MKAMETLQDLIEEVKVRAVWWGLCIFAVCYFLTHTSTSMWMNLPIAILLVCGLRILFNEVEFRRKVRNVRPPTYLAHLEKKQLSVNDSRLSTSPPTLKWKRKIGAPIVEAAAEEFIDKVLHDFVIDLWYSDITPDKEAPELMHEIIMDVLGEISGRVKGINLVELLTRDVVDLVGDHLDLFRRNQAAIGVDVMGTLSSEERDERLKHHLLVSKELHPALISAESEYKVLQRLMGGILAVVLRPREAQSPLVRCIARELLTSLVVQPLLNFASPGYINELIEYIFLAYNDEGCKESGDGKSTKVKSHNRNQGAPSDSVKCSESDHKQKAPTNSQGTDMSLCQYDHRRELSLANAGSSISSPIQDEANHPRPGDWARVLEAATQRRTEVLMPENLENMWAIGRNYKKKLQKNSAAGGVQTPGVKPPVSSGKDAGKDLSAQKSEVVMIMEDKPRDPNQPHDQRSHALHLSQELKKEAPSKGGVLYDVDNASAIVAYETKTRLKRSNSTSDLIKQQNTEDLFMSKGGGSIISEFYSAEFRNAVPSAMSASDMVIRGEGHHRPKLKCRVLGAYFEKLGSKSFAVYSIAVTDANNNTWFVKRRYRNFERLHRHLKDIPNYTLHLPPKRIFSSSTEDAFVHQRCIQLDKYLQDLLSIANVAEQHEVWDFLSGSSKNYSFGKSSSVMRTLAVNVDDAVDDIVRQFKGVSDGLMRKVVGSPSSYEPITSTSSDRNLSWNVEEINKLGLTQSTSESVNSFSDNDDGDKDGTHGHEEVGPSSEANGWHSDTELNSKGFPPRVVKRDEELISSAADLKSVSGLQHESFSSGGFPEKSLAVVPSQQEDPAIVPPEWSPPNLSVPILNLVDKIFQLNRRGWLRRQVFWISKEIMQLMMEDAIDDWLLRQIHWLRREDVIAQGIRWIQDILWPNGVFFIKLRNLIETSNCEPNQGSVHSTRQLVGNTSKAGSFEEQLEATRRASDVKKMLYDGAPATLVSLIGHKQYRRCARDLYYFLQSTICLKQLTYGVLELVLISVFPELRDLVKDIHEKAQAQPV
ncbi:uncharacterized protein LOC132599107 isoform X1 [Lycium barbarum]|uniref:uncharacterized protein LOC132599107 isoform X1 n=1 Tax=Lycium barbarum TaxID=112863 RepID=UPI00293F704A|nr:uncharacterized protein LOC132599107 isoform X1 [Lycium barbarum]